MTAKQVLNAKAGQKVGLGNGLRLVCDARNGARYFELRKRVRGKDYSWGVGSVETLTIAGCNKALSSARQQADKILDALASGADPSGIGKSAKSGEVLTGRSPVVMSPSNLLLDKGQEWFSDAYRDRWLNSLEIHCKWLMDSPIADVTLDIVIEAIQPHWHVRTDTAERWRGSCLASSPTRGTEAPHRRPCRPEVPQSCATPERQGSAREDTVRRWTTATALPCSPSSQRAIQPAPRHFSG